MLDSSLDWAVIFRSHPKASRLRRSRLPWKIQTFSAFLFCIFSLPIHLSETEERGISWSSRQTFHKLREVAAFAPKTGTERELKSFLNPLEFRPRLKEVSFVPEKWIKGKLIRATRSHCFAPLPLALTKKGDNPQGKEWRRNRRHFVEQEAFWPKIGLADVGQ